MSPSPAWPEPLLSRPALAEGRERRVVLLLLAVWMVNLFDLGFTLLAHEQRLLVEMNPLADRLLVCGPAAVTCYKLVLLTTGSLILWRYRRRRIAERAAWIAMGACVMLALLWHKLYLDADPTWTEANLASEILPKGSAVGLQFLDTPG